MRERRLFAEHSLHESSLTALLLISLTVLLVILILLLPLLVVFGYAFEQGAQAVVTALTNEHALHALSLTVQAAVLAVICNLVFGLSAAWCLARFRFPGRSILLTVLDLPFAISPIIAGMLFVLLYGLHGYFAPLLKAFDVQIIFAFSGVVMATIFVTLPFIARELIPLMEELGSSEEEAALTMGASGWQMFWHVTIPNIRWGIIYGVILTNARAMGEFGAVSVVSGHLRGETNTLPLHIEILYNEFHTQAAFACAALLACLALLTLVLKAAIEFWRGGAQASH